MSFGTVLRSRRSSGPGPAELRAMASAAETRDALTRLTERLEALEGVIGQQSLSIDEQFQDHHRRLAALGEQMWPEDTDQDSFAENPSRLDLVEGELSLRSSQVADLLTGLEAVSRVYSERLLILQNGIQAVQEAIVPQIETAIAQSATSVQAAYLQTGTEAMRVLYESAMSRLAAAETMFRTLQESGTPFAQAEEPSRPAALAATAEGAGERATAVAVELHGLVRDAARRQPGALKAIDDFADAFAALSADRDAARGGSRPRFGALGPDIQSSVPTGASIALSIVSVGEGSFGMGREVYRPLVEAGAVANLRRMTEGEDASDLAAADFLIIHDVSNACDIIEDVGHLMNHVVCVQCRVAFVPKLHEQDLFADVDRDLQALGFEFVDLVRTGRGGYDGVAGESFRSRLLWAEAVYVRPPEPPGRLSPESMLRAAYLTHTVYQMYDLAARYLTRYDAVAGGTSAAKYRASVASAVQDSASGPAREVT